MQTAVKRTIEFQPTDLSPQHFAVANLTLSLLPYDVPWSVTVAREGKHGELRIVFDYLDREKSNTQHADDDLDLLLGERSGKLLGFVGKRAAADPAAVTAKIHRDRRPV